MVMATLFCRLISENQENGRNVCNIVAWAFSLSALRNTFSKYIFIVVIITEKLTLTHICSNFNFEKYFITELIVNGVERENALLKIRV